GPTAMARPFVAPPGLSVDKAALLPRDFDATMQDREFRAEPPRIQADLAPTTGEDVQTLASRIYAAPRLVVDRVKKILAPERPARIDGHSHAGALISRRPKPGQK